MGRFPYFSRFVPLDRGPRPPPVLLRFAVDLAADHQEPLTAAGGTYRVQGQGNPCIPVPGINLAF